MSTLSVPSVLTSPRQDAMDLYRAFKGFGCDKSAVVNILAHRDAAQRALIQQEYRAMYSDDLCNRLSSELGGDLEKAVLLWMHDPAGRDATFVRVALTEGSTNLRAATEVICSRTPTQIQVFKQAYHAKFRVHLEHDLNFQTSGDHQKDLYAEASEYPSSPCILRNFHDMTSDKLLLSYVGIPRYEGPEVDQRMVESDARDLYKAGEKRLGTDEKTFIRIFSERSRAHLLAVSSYYKHTYGNSLKKAIKSETSGLFEFALLTILSCAENPAKYFAKVLHKAMKGMGTDDTTLIRNVVGRTEMDMQYIKEEYEKKYKKPLANAIHSETSSHYRTFLLALVGPMK